MMCRCRWMAGSCTDHVAYYREKRDRALSPTSAPRSLLSLAYQLPPRTQRFTLLGHGPYSRSRDARRRAKYTTEEAHLLQARSLAGCVEEGGGGHV